jgi:signal peptidase II
MRKMHKANNHFRKHLIIVGAIVALILILDQTIKIYIKTHFSPGESVPVFGSWFSLEYLENQGMAFGTTFGNKMWHKLALSIFRIVAITGMAVYLIRQAKKGVRLELLIVIGLILAGATGNLIDSMFYDFIFPYDPCMGFNHLEGSGIKTDCGIFGEIETRYTGFLLGNVVDMFKFQAFWPEWIPVLGGREVFPAIWNFADASISVGVILIFIRQRSYFPKEKTGNTED